MPVTNPNNSVKGKKEGNENTKRGVKIPRQVVFFPFRVREQGKIKSTHAMATGLRPTADIHACHPAGYG
jgi:hypothetical protein